MNPVDIKSVKENVQQAVEKTASDDKDEIKQLSNMVIGTEAVGLAEINLLSATKHGTENIVKGARYTVTRFSDENRRKRKESREESREYNRNRKEIRQVNKNIRETEREIKRTDRQAKKERKGEKTEKSNQLGMTSGTMSNHEMKRGEGKEKISQFQENKEKYIKNRNNLKERKKQLTRKNKAIRKRRNAERHTRNINIIKQRAGGSTKGVGKEMIKIPNRFALMIASDLEADKLAMTTASGLLYSISKIFGNTMKLLIQSFKSILMALCPAILISAFAMFMIYIMFFSDFNSYFDMGIEKNMISSEEPEDVGSIINSYIVNRRNEMAKEIVETDNSIQVYFVKLDDTTVNETVLYINEQSKELAIPTIMFDEWVNSSEADLILKDLANKMCYRLTDEDAAGYMEENLEAYSGNIVPEQPEENTEPETESTENKPGGQIGIGGGIGIGIGSGVTKPEQPEPETPALEQNVRKAVIGYHSVNEIQ